MARSFEEFFVGYAQDPIEFLQNTFEEIEGYENDCAAWYPLREPL